jgi:hypothetical protein
MQDALLEDYKRTRSFSGFQETIVPDKCVMLNVYSWL